MRPERVTEALLTGLSQAGWLRPPSSLSFSLHPSICCPCPPFFLPPFSSSIFPPFHPSILCILQYSRLSAASTHPLSFYNSIFLHFYPFILPSLGLPAVYPFHPCILLSLLLLQLRSGSSQDKSPDAGAGDFSILVLVRNHYCFLSSFFFVSRNFLLLCISIFIPVLPHFSGTLLYFRFSPP